MDAQRCLVFFGSTTPIGGNQRFISAWRLIFVASSFSGVGLYYRCLAHDSGYLRAEQRVAIGVDFAHAAVPTRSLKGSFAALNERVQHDLQDMEREFQLEKERKQLQVIRGLLRKAFPEIEV